MGKLVDQFQAQIEKLEKDASPDVKKQLQQKLSQYAQFKCSQAWICNFMRRQWFHNVKGRGEEGFVDQHRLVIKRLQFNKELCEFDISCISNTDEVANLYRTLPRRSVRDSDKVSSYALVKDRLIAVLIVYADGRKALLTIIGTAKRPQSSPCHFDTALDLGCFYMARANAWNTQSLWAQMFRGLNKRSQQQFRKSVIALDNYSAHSISYEEFDSPILLFLPPHITSVLRPVDASIGQSFKCSFHHRLCAHILEYVEKMLRVLQENRKPFKIRKAVTAYDAFRLMKEAWDDVPISVELKGWLKADILSTPQITRMRQLLLEVGKEKRPAENEFQRQFSSTDRPLAEAVAKRAFEEGVKLLENFVSESMDADLKVSEYFFDSESLREICHYIQKVCSINELRNTVKIEDITEEELMAITNDEYIAPICKPVDQETAFVEAVDDALELLDINAEGTSNDQGSSAEPAVQEQLPSDQRAFLVRFAEALRSVQNKAAFFKSQEHEFVENRDERLELVVEQQISQLATFRKETRRQSRIGDFFKN